MDCVSARAVHAYYLSCSYLNGTATNGTLEELTLMGMRSLKELCVNYISERHLIYSSHIPLLPHDLQELIEEDLRVIPFLVAFLHSMTFSRGMLHQ